MNPDTFRLSPDAHFRDRDGQRNSRDVQAVFVSQEVTLRDEVTQELVVQTLPHVELAFEWVDRRAELVVPSAFTAGSRLRAECLEPDGSLARWLPERPKSRVEREFLVVKVPESVIGIGIGIHPDQRATPVMRTIESNEHRGTSNSRTWPNPCAGQSTAMILVRRAHAHFPVECLPLQR